MKTATLLAPSVSATGIRSVGTCQTTLATIRVLKNIVPIRISATFGVSSKPNQMMSSGTNAGAGM